MAKQPKLAPTPDKMPPMARSGGMARGMASLIVLTVILAWSNTLHAPFVLDEHSSILDNETLRDFWSWGWLFPPATGGETVSGRPVLNLSFALNHAVGGLEVSGYHVVNGLIHAFSALLLYGIVRRTVARSARSGGGERDAHRPTWWAEGFAGGVALLWAVHPLQTAAVTYVAQRAESLAGLFFLLTLYGFIRGVEFAPGKRRWMVASVIACLLGMGTKETMVAAPIVVLLYDRAFVAGSLGEAWRLRGRWYTALAATWFVLAGLVWSNHGRGGSAGWGAVIDPWAYFLIQGEAIPHYLALGFWPVGLVFDHGVTPVPSFGAALPGLALLSAAAAATVWALRRNRPEGFLGACFFVLLAPSSSFVPVTTQTVAEHRMYLPLAALVVLLGLALARWSLFRKTATFVTFCALATLALGIMTWTRNQTYRSALTLWQDTVAKCPDNPRARNNLGLALLVAGQMDEAATQLRRAIELQPNHAFAHCNLGTILLTQGRFAEAAIHFNAALAADPGYVSARVNLGQALTGLGRPDEAAQQYQIAWAQDPTAYDAATNLAALRIDQGRVDEGAAILRKVLAASPTLAEAYYHLGRAQERQEEARAAEASWRAAVRLKPSFAPAHLALGNCLVRRGEVGEAESCWREALRLDPRLAEAHYALGNLLAKQRHFEAAADAYRAVLQINPAHVQARNNLGNCLLVTHRWMEAVATYEEVLRRRPGDEAVQRNLELAREFLRAGGAAER